MIRRTVAALALLALASACSKPAATPGPAAPGAAAPSAASGATLSGTVSIAPELAGAVAPTDVLFIIARKAEQGPPLAVKKIDAPTFPLRYELGAQDMMFHGASLAGEVSLQARLDKDGDAITRQEGDLQGSHPGGAVVGASNADILIDRPVEKAVSPVASPHSLPPELLHALAASRAAQAQGAAPQAPAPQGAPAAAE